MSHSETGHAAGRGRGGHGERLIAALRVVLADSYLQHQRARSHELHTSAIRTYRAAHRGVAQRAIPARAAYTPQA